MTLARDAAISDRSTAPTCFHEARLDSRQSRSGQFRHRHAQDAGRRALALCALAAAGRAAAARSAFFRAAASGSKNISRPCAICARAALRSRRSTGAARACPIARCAIAARAMCATSPNTTSISKPSCARSCCRIVRRRFSRSAIRPARRVLIRAAHRGHRWFDRMVLTAPLIALGGIDYSMGAGPLIVRALRLAGFGTHVRAQERHQHRRIAALSSAIS